MPRWPQKKANLLGCERQAQQRSRMSAKGLFHRTSRLITYHAKANLQRALPSLLLTVSAPGEVGAAAWLRPRPGRPPRRAQQRRWSDLG
jgi:hypothetical protein